MTPDAQRRAAQTWPRVIIASSLLMLAYQVMPDGPWYRQIGATILVLVSEDVLRDGKDFWR